MMLIFRGVESLEMGDIGGAFHRWCFFPGLEDLDPWLGKQERMMLWSQPCSTAGSLSFRNLPLTCKMVILKSPGESPWMAWLSLLIKNTINFHPGFKNGYT